MVDTLGESAPRDTGHRLVRHVVGYGGGNAPGGKGMQKGWKGKAPRQEKGNTPEPPANPPPPPIGARSASKPRPPTPPPAKPRLANPKPPSPPDSKKAVPPKKAPPASWLKQLKKDGVDVSQAMDVLNARRGDLRDQIFGAAESDDRRAVPATPPWRQGASSSSTGAASSSSTGAAVTAIGTRPAKKGASSSSTGAAGTAIGTRPAKASSTVIGARGSVGKGTKHEDEDWDGYSRS